MNGKFVFEVGNDLFLKVKKNKCWCGDFRCIYRRIFVEIIYDKGK